MKNKKGFTLVELVIVIIIVGILSIVSVPIYNSYVEKAYLTEGQALIGQVITAQKIYYAEYGHYASEGSVSDMLTKGTLLDVDASSNKYFKKFRSLSKLNGQAFNVVVEHANGILNNVGWLNYDLSRDDLEHPDSIYVVYRDGTYKLLK